MPPGRGIVGGWEGGGGGGYGAGGEGGGGGAGDAYGPRGGSGMGGYGMGMGGNEESSRESALRAQQERIAKVGLGFLPRCFPLQGFGFDVQHHLFDRIVSRAVQNLGSLFFLWPLPWSTCFCLAVASDYRPI